MSTWSDLEVDVIDGLLLDPRNVRLDLPINAPQADIIYDLFANEKVLTMVEAIAQVGFLTHEVPVVVERGGKFVVVEGNRRVAALKAIQNPYLAPAHQAKITKAIQEIDRDALRVIRVKMAPSQDEADQLIAALHTGNQRVAWSPSRQAAFFQAQIDAGKSFSALLRQYPTIDVREFVVRSKILQLFRDVPYKDPALSIYINDRRFKGVSTLARLYEYDKFLTLAGIVVNKEKAIVRLESPQSIFNKLAEQIIGDIKDKVINTRSLNRTDGDEYIGYMDRLRELVNDAQDMQPDPAPSRSGGGSSSSGRAGNGSAAAGGGRASGSAGPAGGSGSGSSGGVVGKGAGTTTRPQPAPLPPRKFLDVSGMSVDRAYPAPIHRIFEELQTLNVERHPNAALDLVRTFLEKTIKAYADKVNEKIAKASNRDGLVQLGDCLIWLEGYVKDNNRRAFVQVVQKLRGGSMGSFGYVISKDHLNAINHNHEIFATPEDVRLNWAAMKSLVAMMLA